LLDVIAGLEVTLDFPDDTVGVDPHDAVPTLRALAADVAAWRARAQRGRMVHEGLTIAIVGTPNAGKSSLLNALVGRERAIVSPLAGTTRDVVEATIELGGIPIRLLDTAGIDEPRDVLEAEGIKRSRAAIAESDLLLVVVDASRPLISDVLLETAHMPRVVVRAKTDLTPHASTCLLDAVAVSVVTGAGLEELIRRIAAEVERRSDDGAEALLVSVRQMDALERLERALRMGADALPDAPIEVALVELRDALRESSALLGEGVGEAVLDRIFATFCVGK
jgi:tRNA modification GTPase